MIGRRFLLLFAGILLATTVGLSLHLLAVDSEATGPSALNQMRLDATAGGSVDTSRNVVGTAAFSVGVHVTQIQAAYSGYNWQLRYPTGTVAFVGGSAVENTAGTTLAICNAPNEDTTTILGTTILGANSAGCITFGAATSFLGQVTTLDLQCASDGSFAVGLVDTDLDPISGSSVQDSTGSVLDTGTAGITINCSGTGSTLPTETPTATATNTNTPGPTFTATATSTPCVGAGCTTPTLPPDFTRTPTPSASETATVTGGTPAATEPATGGTPPPPPAATAPGGRPGGVIAGPDTGSGGYATDDGGSGKLATALIALSLIATGGAAWASTRHFRRNSAAG